MAIKNGIISNRIKVPSCTSSTLKQRKRIIRYKLRITKVLNSISLLCLQPVLHLHDMLRPHQHFVAAASLAPLTGLCSHKQPDRSRLSRVISAYVSDLTRDRHEMRRGLGLDPCDPGDIRLEPLRSDRVALLNPGHCVASSAALKARCLRSVSRRSLTQR